MAVDDTASWWYSKLMIWQVDKKAVDKLASKWNGNLMQWQVDDMVVDETTWQSKKFDIFDHRMLVTWWRRSPRWSRASVSSSSRWKSTSVWKSSQWCQLKVKPKNYFFILLSVSGKIWTHNLWIVSRKLNHCCCNI